MTDESSRWSRIAIIISIVAMVLSTITAWSVALFTAREALYDRSKQGEVVFQDIGYRYFSIVSTYGKDDLDSQTEYAYRVYRALLKGVLEDIRWLRTNPTYNRNTERDLKCFLLSSFSSFTKSRRTLEISEQPRSCVISS